MVEKKLAVVQRIEVVKHDAYLPQVQRAPHPPARITHHIDGRQQQADQDSDDRDDNQQFNESKGGFASKTGKHDRNSPNRECYECQNCNTYVPLGKSRNANFPEYSALIAYKARKMRILAVSTVFWHLAIIRAADKPDVCEKLELPG